MINIRDVTPSQLRALQFSVRLAEGEAIVSAKHGAPTGARHLPPGQHVSPPPRPLIAASIVIITAPGSALDEIHREPAKLVSLYFDCMSAPVWRMGGDDAVERDAVCPVVMQRQGRRGATALTTPRRSTGAPPSLSL
jgi:hypothetical protein